MKNKVVYVVVVHKPNISFACGIVYNTDEEHRRKLMNYILSNAGIRFSDLMTADLEAGITPVVYADNSDKIYLSLERTANLR